VKYQAVIFDLGDTLARSATWSEYAAAARRVASMCSAPENKFVELWFAHSAGLGTGLYPAYRDYIRFICRFMDLEMTDNILALGEEVCVSLTRQTITRPRENAVEVLSYLKSNGYKIGLISDCHYDVPQVWPETPFAPFFDVTVFSCQAGMNKSNPHIFEIALEKLGVKAKDCMYIADGNRNELANAKKLGMHAVQILVPGEIDDSPIREEWHGPRISSLKEILDLLK
jgi:putative hydrolase of the HAD superfamily